ncbi:hypothetical protein N0V90_002415 [Kalmusia sp. IMI 367209]|nr:hypothetical protein N0V90_002415 [Kalmusia sp. IMI 367209]
MSSSQKVQASYGALLSDDGLITINPRCAIDGGILFGGSNPGQRQFEAWLEKHPERCVDDSLVNFKSITDAVQAFVESQFSDWTTSPIRPEEFHSEAWSGIIGLSADSVPFIGQLPGHMGQWVCVGHHGHGMARIFTAAPGLVKLMNGESWASTQLPEVFEITRSRLERIRQRTAMGTVVARL